MRRMLMVVVCASHTLFYCATGQNCHNAGFEQNTTQGYVTYTGSINSEGNVEIETTEIDDERHRVVHVTDGFDEIVDFFCDFQLPVVPPGRGQYALRLGNSDPGGEAERILLNFTVTPSVSFFLLRYAVVLEDPEHDYELQPRFEMRILDKNGNVFPCGQYQVRAGPDNPGFVSCGNWRVRPWTTVGFELQSFIGQDISIEILTTDCALGGHGGYAYLDATCKPLELKLEGFCPDSSYAKYSATDGFTEYLWNTGATGNEIEIDNPVSGDIYSVTVTSASGCDLVLTDTLPMLESTLLPEIDVIEDKALCPDESFWLKPSGQNIEEFYCLELNYSADSFFIAPLANSVYTIVAFDKYRCLSDTVSFMVEMLELDFELEGETNICQGDSFTLAVVDPQIQAIYELVSSSQVAEEWNLAPTEDVVYTIRSTIGQRCYSEQMHYVEVRIPQEIELTVPNDVTTCNDENILLEASGSGIGQILWDGFDPGENGIRLRPEVSRYYKVHVIGEQGCTEASDSFFVTVDSELVIDLGDDLCVEEAVLLSVPDEIGVSYEWSDASSYTSMEVAETGYYSVTATNSCGSFSDEIFIIHRLGDCSIYVPNAFSPNNDGINDVFTPFFGCDEELYDIFRMEIFDRWGNKVFSAFELDNLSWTAYDAKEDTYIYTMQFTNELCDEVFTFQGDISIIK